MINIVDQERCSGCYACINACNHDAISMVKGEDWHIYPHVDLDRCIDCGECDRSCPFLNEKIKHKVKPHSFAAYNKDYKERMQSTSGGIFPVFANYILNKGGKVCAARFDGNWNVIHDFVSSNEELLPFQKSKYIQSNIGLAYRDIKKMLFGGFPVLFVGLPCQVAGLKHYLKRDFDNLYTLELICMGIASPYLWKEYLKVFESEKIKNITFKDKAIGWYHSDWRMILEYYHKKPKVTRGRENPFMYGYLDRMYYRPSCYKCIFKSPESCADVTIGDAWGLENYNPDFLDNKGTSTVIVNTEKGDRLVENVKDKMFITEFSYDKVIKSNKYLCKSVSRSKEYEQFYKILSKKGVKAAMNKCCKKKKSIARGPLKWVKSFLFGEFNRS